MLTHALLADYDAQRPLRVSAREKFGRYFGKCLESSVPDWQQRGCIPPQAQREVARAVGRLNNAPPSAGKWFVENHSGFFENLIVTGAAAIASCGGGGAFGHWWQDGARKFELLHPSLGAIFGAIGGIWICFSVLNSAHRKLMGASHSEARYEKSVVAGDALISGYITVPEVQMELLAVVKEPHRKDGGWPEPVRYKILEIEACNVLAPGVRLF